MHFNTVLYDASLGGDPVLYQHLFWFFAHPEVYILIVPGFGIISQVMSTTAQKMLFGNLSMLLAMGCISFIGCIVWGHHIYTIGLDADTRAYFTATTMMISLPTGSKVFNWLCTYLGNSIHEVSGYTLFVLLLLFTFTIGGSTGVVLGNAAVDNAVHDTFFVVAHFHFTLSLGAIVALFSGISFLQDNLFGMSNYLVNTANARYHFMMTLFGINLTFLPIHLLGFNVMPRRMSDLPDNFNAWNYLSSIGSVMTLLGLLFFIK